MKLKVVCYICILLLLIGISNTYAYQWPTVSKFITSDFGPRTVEGGTWFHGGIDIRAPIGTMVFAVAPGKVEFVGGTDRTISINHNGTTSRYLHLDLDRYHVKRGDEIKEEQLGLPIAFSGDAPGGPHLHFDFDKEIPNCPHPLKYLPYEGGNDPIVRSIKVLRGEGKIKARVLTESDKDLNEVKILFNGIVENETTDIISYDPMKPPNEDGMKEVVDPRALGDDIFIFSKAINQIEQAIPVKIVTIEAKDAEGRIGRKLLHEKTQIIAIDNSYSMTQGWVEKIDKIERS